MLPSPEFFGKRRFGTLFVLFAEMLIPSKRIRHLPVVRDGSIAAVISIGDVVKFQSQQQSFQIKYLTDYITAR